MRDVKNMKNEMWFDGETDFYYFFFFCNSLDTKHILDDWIHLG